ncbi:MAG: RNB domain-containing ribonuclease, partial [Bacteroidales bacterium]|nr:RNB domain-containing ribonuclease [Bacteroidales bacterium]
MNKRRKSGNSTNERKGRGGNNSKKSHGKKVYKEVEGTLKMSRDGSAFLIVEGREDDIYIRAAKTRGALNGDKVKVAIKKTASAPGKHAEGDVIAVIERSTKPFIGVLHIVGNQAWVLMQSKFMPYDISIEVKDKDDKSCKGALRSLGHNEYAVTGVYETVDGKKKELQAHLGMKVAAVVDDWPRGANNPVGHLVDVLGELGENDTEMHAILAEYGLPYRFEPEVENAADKISEEITAKDIKERRDFRDTLTFTIDPADAKDFDDALSFRRLANGNYEVGVHIADVSHYVTPGTPVDKEAQSRGTSVYLVDRTVPMLPEKLCNKLCSLRPNEEKLTFSAVFEISPSGKVFNQWIGRTVIKSDHRFNYDQAQDIIEDKESPVSQELKDAVKTLWDLASIFRKRRFASGAISFERPEMKVDVDENGKPIGVHQHISQEANWLIEEFMLLANRTVAEFIA